MLVEGAYVVIAYPEPMGCPECGCDSVRLLVSIEPVLDDDRLTMQPRAYFMACEHPAEGVDIGVDITRLADALERAEVSSGASSRSPTSG